jgi:hypothetical protein
MSDDLQRMFPGIDDDPGPARRLSSAKAAAMTKSIVQQALAGEEPAPVAEAPVVTKRGRRIAILAAAIVFGTVGVATGAAWFARTRAEVPAISPAVEEMPRPSPPPRAPVAPPAPVVIDEPAPLDLPAETAPPRRRVTPPPPPSDELPADAPVEDVLALANQRRKAKRWRDAAELYERVRTAYRGTDAAIVATIAAAGLHLDHLDDAAGARRRYEAALQLAPRGPLAEEARWGLVECARANADADAERDALRAFLAHHADSPNARAARARLAELR